MKRKGEEKTMKKILKASTMSGARWIVSAKKEEGYRLSDVYGSYSTEKEKAYNDCFSKCVSAEKSKNFHIFSYNTFGFSVAWEETIENEEYLHIETPKNTYIVALNQ
jgi:hypothetical protein